VRRAFEAQTVVLPSAKNLTATLSSRALSDIHPLFLELSHPIAFADAKCPLWSLG
jgi:hypothetical protein